MARSLPQSRGKYGLYGTLSAPSMPQSRGKYGPRGLLGDGTTVKMNLLLFAVTGVALPSSVCCDKKEQTEIIYSYEVKIEIYFTKLESVRAKVPHIRVQADTQTRTPSQRFMLHFRNGIEIDIYIYCTQQKVHSWSFPTDCFLLYTGAFNFFLRLLWSLFSLLQRFVLQKRKSALQMLNLKCILKLFDMTYSIWWHWFQFQLQWQ